MPVYCYICPECGHRTEEMRLVEKRNDPSLCNKCEKCPFKRDFQAEHPADYGTDYEKPLISDSMAVGAHPDLIKDQQRKHPDVKFTKMGQPVFRSRKQKLDYMKKEGFYCKNTYS